MDILIWFAYLTWAAMLVVFVTLRTSPENMIRTGLWLIGQGRARREIRAASQASFVEARHWTVEQEGRYLPVTDRDKERRVMEVRR